MQTSDQYALFCYILFLTLIPGLQYSTFITSPFKQNKTKKLRKRLLFSLRKISEIYFSKQISSTFYALGILKMGQPRHLFNLFLSFQTNNTNLTTNKCENVHPVSGAGIRTHNLLITSLLPEPLDQGSRPRFRNL